MRVPHLAGIAAVALAASSCSVLQQVAAPSPVTTLRVASYNIRHGRGMDDQVDLGRIATVLRQHQPDIVALQEVDDRVTRSGRVDQATELGRLLDLDARFAEFMPYQGGRYGMAVLSRYPIRSSRAIPLPPGGEPRVALAVEVELPSRARMLVVNVHFDWADDDAARFRQASVLADSLDAQALPWMVVGDYNDVATSRTHRLFRDRGLEAAKDPSGRLTFPSRDPVKEIDHLVVYPRTAWRVNRVEVIAETLASDHRPVVAVLEHRRD